MPERLVVQTIGKPGGNVHGGAHSTRPEGACH